MHEQRYSIEHRKFNLINLITQLEDIEKLAAIEILLAPQKEEDWWDTISEEEQQAIDVGVEDIKQGRVIPHEQVMKKFKERYKNLT